MRADETGADVQSTARMLVLNALSETILGTRNILSMEESRSLVKEVYAGTTDPATRSEFERAIEELAGINDAEVKEIPHVVSDVVGDVTAALESRDVGATLSHETAVDFSPRQAALYSFVRSPAPDTIDRLNFPESVSQLAGEGAHLASEKEFERAAAKFDQALEASDDRSSVSLRLLAGWSYFWAGDERRAADIADEALHLDLDTWEAKRLWIAATHRRSDEIRAGDFDVAVLLKWICDVPMSGSLVVEIGNVCSGGVTWHELSLEGDFDVLPKLSTETRLRFRIEAPLQSFPSLQGYYLGLATVSTKWHEIKSIERVFHTGPMGVDAVERLAFAE